MASTIDLFGQYQRARDFALDQAKVTANAIIDQLRDVQNKEAFVRLDLAELVSQVTRLAELQNEVIEKNRAIRSLGDQAIAEAGH